MKKEVERKWEEGRGLLQGGVHTNRVENMEKELDHIIQRNRNEELLKRLIACALAYEKVLNR